MLKVTVAIPVYNSAKQLEVALDSLLHQTMPATDFEVICVNDCSNDNSKEVIENYRQRMSNLILIDRTENSGGPSAPRNDAMEAAQGDYIHFMDSDDFLGEEALERLYRVAKKNGSDVIFGRHVGVNGRGVPTAMFKRGTRLKADIVKDNLVYTLAPHKMFRRAFIQDKGLRFHPEVKTANEDQLFVMQCYITAKVITILADYDYYFVVARGNENISAKTYPADKFFFVYYPIMEFMDDFIPNVSYRKEIKVAFLNRFFKEGRIRKTLVSPTLLLEKRQEWLHELKKFIDMHVGTDLINSLHPDIHLLIRIAKDMDVQKLARLHYEKGIYILK